LKWRANNIQINTWRHKFYHGSSQCGTMSTRLVSYNREFGTTTNSSPMHTTAAFRRTKLHIQTSVLSTIEPCPFLWSSNHKNTTINIDFIQFMPSFFISHPYISYYIEWLHRYITMDPIPRFLKYNRLWSKTIQLLQY